MVERGYYVEWGLGIKVPRRWGTCSNTLTLVWGLEGGKPFLTVDEYKALVGRKHPTIKVLKWLVKHNIAFSIKYYEEKY